ncbi:hypothetical protein Nepgr_008059 [Nepenthes gracilis]|uniref:Uncharacterized protein n=1 Tax=Nepenthes gracilis TaxID=150966 RepID=A0AAD3S8D9_NEPGR|nr:hypothetical protein Nepgr_008059 [Nepenthes gracilis]
MLSWLIVLRDHHPVESIFLLPIILGRILFHLVLLGRHSWHVCDWECNSKGWRLRASAGGESTVAVEVWSLLLFKAPYVQPCSASEMLVHSPV